MNNNVAIQSNGVIAWDGTAGRLHKITDYTRFAWAFEVVTDIVTETVFKIVSAPPSAADPCVAGASSDVKAVAICTDPITPAPNAEIKIAAGTKAGTICSGTIPCYPNAFVGLAAVSGDTGNVLAVLIRTGPTRS